ncbi:MAG: hypothetical protein C0517_06650 [Erythrobacter sp.]|nr:hypothetical protein [Erythrobacter sp.]
MLQNPAIDGLMDEEGRVWPSLRDYLWEGRLGMTSSQAYPVDEGCELLLAVLHAMSIRLVTQEQSVQNFFLGIWREGRFFRAWLCGQGLTQGSEVTVEGRAVMRMLAATRKVDAPDLAPLEFPTLHPWNGLDRGITRQQREKVMAAQEALGRLLRYRFIRQAVTGQPAIALIGYELGNNIPLTRVLWTLTFPDDYARDRLFAWIAHHLDCWQSWGEMAADSGSRALSEHLLLLRFADEMIDLG